MRPSCGSSKERKHQTSKTDAPHLATGRRGERAAFFYLRREGFIAAARGWRSGIARGDLDLVAREDDTISFCRGENPDDAGSGDRRSVSRRTETENAAAAGVALPEAGIGMREFRRASMVTCRFTLRKESRRISICPAGHSDGGEFLPGNCAIKRGVSASVGS